MARIVLKTMHPFVSWDPVKKYGKSSAEFFFTLEYETARTLAGAYPFRSVMHVDGERLREKTFTGIDDALEDVNKQVRAMSRSIGWTPESELE